MAERDLTASAIPRKRVGGIATNRFADGPAQQTFCQEPRSDESLSRGTTIVQAMRAAQSPRQRAPYERFVDRHVVESLGAFARGARRRAEGERGVDLASAAAAQSIGRHRELNRILAEIVELRPEAIQCAREARQWAACGRALLALFKALRGGAALRAGTVRQRDYVRSALKEFTDTVKRRLGPAGAERRSRRGRPAVRPIDASFAACAVRGARQARRALNQQVPSRVNARVALRAMESAFSDAFASYFVEIDGKAHVTARFAAIAECARPALYELLRARADAIPALEAKRPKHGTIADGSTLAIWFVAQWYAVSQTTAKRTMRGLPIQKARIVDRVVRAESGHSRAHDKTVPRDAERTRRAPDRRQSRAAPQHDSPSVRRPPGSLADSDSHRASSPRAGAP